MGDEPDWEPHRGRSASSESSHGDRWDRRRSPSRSPGRPVATASCSSRAAPRHEPRPTAIPERRKGAGKTIGKAPMGSQQSPPWRQPVGGGKGGKVGSGFVVPMPAAYIFPAKGCPKGNVPMRLAVGRRMPFNGPATVPYGRVGMVPLPHAQGRPPLLFPTRGRGGRLLHQPPPHSLVSYGRPGIYSVRGAAGAPRLGPPAGMPSHLARYPALHGLAWTEPGKGKGAPRPFRTLRPVGPPLSRHTPLQMPVGSRPQASHGGRIYPTGSRMQPRFGPAPSGKGGASREPKGFSVIPRLPPGKGKSGKKQSAPPRPAAVRTSPLNGHGLTPTVSRFAQRSRLGAGGRMTVAGAPGRPLHQPVIGKFEAPRRGKALERESLRKSSKGKGKGTKGAPGIPADSVNNIPIGESRLALLSDRRPPLSKPDRQAARATSPRSGPGAAPQRRSEKGRGAYYKDVRAGRGEDDVDPLNILDPSDDDTYASHVGATPKCMAGPPKGLLALEDDLTDEQRQFAQGEPGRRGSHRQKKRSHSGGSGRRSRSRHRKKRDRSKSRSCSKHRASRSRSRKRSRSRSHRRGGQSQDHGHSASRKPGRSSRHVSLSKVMLKPNPVTASTETGVPKGKASPARTSAWETWDAPPGEAKKELRKPSKDVSKDIVPKIETKLEAKKDGRKMGDFCPTQLRKPSKDVSKDIVPKTETKLEVTRESAEAKSSCDAGRKILTPDDEGMLKLKIQAMKRTIEAAGNGGSEQKDVKKEKKRKKKRRSGKDGSRKTGHGGASVTQSVSNSSDHENDQRGSAPQASSAILSSAPARMVILSEAPVVNLVEDDRGGRKQVREKLRPSSRGASDGSHSRRQ